MRAFPRDAVWIALVRALALTGVVLAVLGFRVITASRAALIQADEQARVRRWDDAITSYRRAASWYAPGNLYSQQATTRLADLAVRAEHEGDSTRALRAWRALRAAAMAGRSFFTPHADLLAHANERIAHFAATPSSAALTPREAQLRFQKHVQSLQPPASPSLLFASLALIAFSVWLTAALMFMRRAIDEDGRLIASDARRWGTAIVIGLGVFLVMLGLA